jgi:hypothetical protein
MQFTTSSGIAGKHGHVFGTNRSFNMASKRATMVDALEQASQNAVLMGQCRAAAEARNEGARASLAALFKVGHIGRDIRDTPAGLPWHPERMERRTAFDLFAKTHATTPGKLWQAIFTVSIYTAEQLEMFLARKSETYQQMTPEHLRVITGASTDGIRKQLIEFFYERGPSVQQLRARARKLDRPPGDATRSPPVRNISGALRRLATMSRVLQSNLEGELERMLLRHLRDFAAGKGELHPEAQKKLKSLGDQVMSALDAMAAAAEVITAAEKALTKRQGTAA